MDPRELVLQAEIDKKEWDVVTRENKTVNAISVRKYANNKTPWAYPSTSNHSFTGYKCFVDAFWKNTDHKTGLGWFCFPDSVEGEKMGARGVPRSLSVLHSEMEAVIWAMQSLMELQITEVEIYTDCETVIKIMDHPEDWPAFLPYQEEVVRLRSSFSRFVISLIPRSLNHKADSLARSVREAVCGSPL